MRITKLDDLGLGRVDVLKIDAEGHEEGVLQGASDILEFKPTIMIEVTPGSKALEAR